MDWDSFTEALAETGEAVLPYVEEEITPAAGPVNLDTAKGKSLVKSLVMSQFFNMKYHAGDADYNQILITGGASANDGIAQIISDVFQAEVKRLTGSDSACLGAALRAAHACEETSWKQLFQGFCQMAPESFTPKNNLDAEFENFKGLVEAL